jgi:hypothetical protein
VAYHYAPSDLVPNEGRLDGKPPYPFVSREPVGGPLFVTLKQVGLAGSVLPLDGPREIAYLSVDRGPDLQQKRRR